MKWKNSPPKPANLPLPSNCAALRALLFQTNFNTCPRRSMGHVHGSRREKDGGGVGFSFSGELAASGRAGKVFSCSPREAANRVSATRQLHQCRVWVSPLRGKGNVQETRGQAVFSLLTARHGPRDRAATRGLPVSWQDRVATGCNPSWEVRPSYRRGNRSVRNVEHLVLLCVRFFFNCPKGMCQGWTEKNSKVALCNLCECFSRDGIGVLEKVGEIRRVPFDLAVSYAVSYAVFNVEYFWPRMKILVSWRYRDFGVVTCRPESDVLKERNG